MKESNIFNGDGVLLGLDIPDDSAIDFGDGNRIVTIREYDKHTDEEEFSEEPLTNSPVGKTVQWYVDNNKVNPWDDTVVCKGLDSKKLLYIIKNDDRDFLDSVITKAEVTVRGSVFIMCK